MDRSPFFDSVAQGLGKANLMAVWIGQVEVALAPFGVLRRGVRVEFTGHGVLVEGVDVRDVKDDPSPP